MSGSFSSSDQISYNAFGSICAFNLYALMLWSQLQLISRTPNNADDWPHVGCYIYFEKRYRAAESKESTVGFEGPVERIERGPTLNKPNLRATDKLGMWCV
jgi:hypothetical protein